MHRDWLINIRQKKKIPVTEVAKAADITYQMYNFIENGERRPSVETAKKIAKVLDFNWTLFFEDSK